MRQVRAKFRCMSVAKNWSGETTVELSAVYGRGDNEENKQFWKFTPSGSAKLNFRGPASDHSGKEFVPGDYYYIDMKSVCEEGGWQVGELTYRSKESGSLELTTRGGKWTVGHNEEGFSYGKVEMGIDNPPAFKAFDPESIWDVQFNWAEKSDD